MPAPVGHPFNNPNGAKIDAIEGHLFHTRDQIRLIAHALAATHAALVDLQQREKEEVSELQALGYQHLRQGSPRRLTEALAAAVQAAKDKRRDSPQRQQEATA